MSLSSLLAMVLLALPAQAHPGGHGGQGEHTAPERAPKAETPVPETLAGVMAELTESLEAADTALATFKIADLHRHGDRITLLARAVPARAISTANPANPELVLAASTRLEARVAEVLRLADKGDLEASKAAMAQATEDLKNLRALAE